MEKKENVIPTDGIEMMEELRQASIRLIRQAHGAVSQSINRVQLATYFTLGAWIVEVQQHGKKRAGYGQQVIQQLASTLSEEFGKGYSHETLKNCRKFYLTYQERIGKPVVSLLDSPKSKPVVCFFEEAFPFQLSWTHYLILMRIKSREERDFYEKEAANRHWGKRELQRQYNSSLYERLLLSTDKTAVMKKVKGESLSERPGENIKDPYVLEFLGLQEKPEYTESDLERRIIDHLQEFLMEMGKGFTFVGRQVRFSFDERHFRVDLVLYNRLLRCFVLIDLKAGDLKHQDLGQMQMYVNYYDRYEKTEDENPTIGILLCREKSDSMVALTLPEDSNIYASKYELYLPDKKLLQEKLEQWIDESVAEQ